MAAASWEEEQSTGRFLEQLASVEAELATAEERHLEAVAAAEAALAKARVLLGYARDREQAYATASRGIVQGVSRPSVRRFLLATQGYLGEAQQAEAAAIAQEQTALDLVNSARTAQQNELVELRSRRAALLARERRRVPQGVDIAAIDQMIEDIPALQPSASVGRECQRCAEPVPRGRKRFCSRECLLLYQEENGHLEHAKRSAYYDYSTDDPEEERW